jgi:iron-sulfur cluster assembly protein
MTTTLRERPKAMRLTEKAAERVKTLIERSDKPIVGVRVGVKKGGCAGMSYTMEYAEAIDPADEIVEDRGVKILIDPRAVLFLIGTEMDWQEDKFQSGFTFHNPNETERCGCGESFRVA